MPPSISLHLIGFLALSATGAAQTPASAQSGPQPAQSTQSGQIDWDKAKQLYQRAQTGEKLAPEEQSYLDRAKQERARQQGGNASDNKTASQPAGGEALSGRPSAQTQAPAADTQGYPPTPPGIAVLHDVVIGKGGDRDLHAEIAYPQNAGRPLPAVIFVHGGGWVSGTNKPSPILQLAQDGFFAASIEYRTSNVAKWPAQIQDCKLAVRWLRANAGKYHVDPNRIGAWGSSAGGHLAACMGTMSDPKFEGDGGYPGVSSAVQAVVDCFGPADFTNYDPASNTPEANRLTEMLFGVPYKQNPELWKSGSPVACVKAGVPPIFIIHGDSDKTVPLAQATAFDAALTKAGAIHQFTVVKNCGHDMASIPGSSPVPNRAEIDKAIYDFLAKHLKKP